RPETLALAVRLTALAGPFILLVSLATVLAGMLNVNGRFFLPALAPAVLNVAAIAGCVAGQPLENWLGVDAVMAVAASYTIGGLAQFFVLYPAIRRHGFRLRPRLNLRHPGLVRIVLLMLPGLLGLAAIQLTNIIDMQVASRFAPGVVSYVEYSFRLVLFPISMAGMALATATLAKASLDVAARDPEALRTTVSRSVAMLFLVATPVGGLLLALAEPVTQALFVGGEFNFDDAHETAVLLQLYALGVAGFCYPRVAIPIFFALGDSLRPMLVALLTIGLKLGLVILLLTLTDLEVRGLVVATSVAVSAEAIVIWWLLRRRIGRMAAGTTASLVKIAAATMLSAAAAAGALYLLPDSWDRPGKLLQLAKLVGGLTLGSGVYLGVCTALGVKELRELLAKVRSKLRPPGPPPGRRPPPATGSD
ncbi:MAG: lipid II flippase MurJ, partial [Myxococcota bacterium]|nr:lipid II flippase MurJ [Myxococcota bacterium]